MRNKRNRENTHQRKKQSHVQDNIYVVRQFAYVHRVARISLLSGKNTKYKIAATIFFFSLMRLLTRLIGITLIHMAALARLLGIHTIAVTNNIYIEIYDKSVTLDS